MYSDNGSPSLVPYPKYVGNWGYLGGETKGVVTYALAPNRQRAFAGMADAAKYMFTKRIFGLGWAVAGLLPWYFAFEYTCDRIMKNQRKNPEDPSYSRKRGY